MIAQASSKSQQNGHKQKHRHRKLNKISNNKFNRSIINYKHFETATAPKVGNTNQGCTFKNRIYINIKLSISVFKN